MYGIGQSQSCGNGQPYLNARDDHVLVKLEAAQAEGTAAHKRGKVVTAAGPRHKLRCAWCADQALSKLHAEVVKPLYVALRKEACRPGPQQAAHGGGEAPQKDLSHTRCAGQGPCKLHAEVVKPLLAGLGQGGAFGEFVSAKKLSRTRHAGQALAVSSTWKWLRPCKQGWVKKVGHLASAHQQNN
eukprot:1142672-Pelagomonas_calceolata.AAC.11